MFKIHNIRVSVPLPLQLKQYYIHYVCKFIYIASFRICYSIIILLCLSR